MLELYAFITTIELTDNEDYYQWELDGKVSKVFKTGDVYSYLRGDLQTMSWAKVIWFPHAIPRHSFNAWIMNLNRSPTRDRLLSWGLQVDSSCLLCNSNNETRDHLYFDCTFSFDLWSQLARRCRIRPYRSWNQTIAQLENLQSPKSTRLLTLLVWQAALYWLWNERNARLHSGVFRSVDVILTLIDRQVRNKIQSFRETSPSLASRMLQRWFETP
ncbi:uncharacterized protein LOC117127836 [Brassica rapa]|uniref:uncharacterized protein LOC117127836 n=1 Tax=Brassica campestris TaxID=3711 RepID=UPI00142DF3C9|nr:uncharacterized protein LOC117127836 [Brassica rapa]